MHLKVHKKLQVIWRCCYKAGGCPQVATWEKQASQTDLIFFKGPHEKPGFERYPIWIQQSSWKKIDKIWLITWIAPPYTESCRCQSIWQLTFLHRQKRPYLQARQTQYLAPLWPELLMKAPSIQAHEVNILLWTILEISVVGMQTTTPKYEYDPLHHGTMVVLVVWHFDIHT